jgi:NADH:ubiquinone oxidoreductase subunit 5 (subunit L)/multisubunit Na+/H+ antiporter MnhA subunit
MHATRERSLGRLGGLIRRMPWVAWCALVGTIAIAGLPPSNGFASEWLLLQAFLFTPSLPHGHLNMLVPVAAASVALVSALSAYVMVKFFGVVFLGQHREPRLAEAREASLWERAGLVWLAAACIALGLVPATVIGLLDPITRMLAGHGIGNLAQGWLFLAPTTAARASYSPLLVFAVTGLLVAVAWLSVRAFYHGRARRAAAWDCGFPDQDARMQDTAEGFGQPVRHVFAPFFRLEQHEPAPDDARPRFSSSAKDRLWYWLYLPVASLVGRLTALVTLLQRGRISVYLAYSFATLLALLLFIR